MKSLLLFFVLAFAGTCLAEEKTVAASPGDTVRVEVVPGRWTTFESEPTTRDIIKALEILAKYAPKEFDDENFTVFSAMGSGGWATTMGMPPRKTKADKVRDEARKLKNQADSKLTQAEEMDDEQKDIKWALGVLAKLKEIK